MLSRGTRTMICVGASVAMLSITACSESAKEPSSPQRDKATGAQDNDAAACSVCEFGTECVKASKPRCEYTTQSPWLLLQQVNEGTADSGVATTSDLLAFAPSVASEQTVFNLSAGALDEYFWASLFQVWSPDGQVLVFDAANGLEERGFESRLYSVEFGKGLPGPPRLVANLPRGGAFEPGAWDAESKAFLVRNGDEIYRVERADNALTPELLFTEEAYAYDYKLCAGGNTLLELVPGEIIVKELGPHATHERHYPEGPYSLSADGRWLAVVVNDGEDADGTRLLVSPCGPGEDLELFTGSGIEGHFATAGSRLILTQDSLPLGYFEPGWKRDYEPFPAGTSEFLDTDSSPSKVWLLRDEAGELFSHEIESGRNLALGIDRAASWQSQGEHLVLEQRDELTQTLTRVDVVNLLSGKKVVRIVPGTSSLGEVLLDPLQHYIAYTLNDDQGSRIVLQSLTDPDVRLEARTPSGQLRSLVAFSADGQGLVLSNEGTALYWLELEAADEELRERPLLSADAAYLVMQQPWH